MEVNSTAVMSKSLNFAFDPISVSRLSMVTDSGAAQPPLEHSYSYDANGSLESLSYSNGVTHNWSYDSQNRLKNLSIRNSSLVILNSYSYTVGASGHRRSITEANGRTVGYTLDNQYCLTQEAISGDPSIVGGISDWSYDLVGNRHSQQSDLASILDQTESYSDNNWLESHTYDANGNTVESSAQLQQASVVLNDSYDWRNRLIRREQSDGTIIEIIYDGFGDRIKKTIRPYSSAISHSTWYQVDRNNLTGYAQVVEEIGQGDELQVIYSYGLDLISQDRRDGDGSGNFTQSFYLYDGLGSIRALTNSTGTVTDTYTYDAWGVLIDQFSNFTIPTSNFHRFTGEQWDADLGMYFLRARYLNVATGRFHTMDTFEGVTTDPVTLHKYLYANASPAHFIDPSGNVSIVGLMQAQWVKSLLVNSAIGASINVVTTIATGGLKGLTVLEVGEKLGVSALSGAATGLIGGAGGKIAGKLFLKFFPKLSSALAQGIIAGGGGSFSAQFAKDLYEIVLQGKPVNFTDRAGRLITATVIGAGIGGLTFNIKPVRTDSYSVLESRLSNGGTVFVSKPIFENTLIDIRGVFGASGAKAVNLYFRSIIEDAFGFGGNL